MFEITLLKMLFTELAKDETSNLLHDSISLAKSNYDLKNSIAETCDFFSKYECKDKDVKAVLNEEFVSRLTKELKTKSGYEYGDIIYNELLAEFKNLEIPYEVADFYATKMLYVIAENTKHIKPSEYDRYFNKAWKEEQDKAIAVITEKLNIINSNMEVYSKDKLKLQTAGAVDLDIRRMTNPQIGLEFFQIDDKEFITSFKHELNNECIYIKARCQEEAVFGVINQLWKQNEVRPVFLVKDKDSWDRLLDAEKINNCIYIPIFHAEEIIAIPGNTNIFICTDEEMVVGKELINLRPRRRRTILQALENAGMQYDKAYKLVENTNGLYIPLKRKIFKGKYNKNPLWKNAIPQKIQRVCLLVGRWTDSEGDKRIIQKLSGIDYHEFMDQVLAYSSYEEPFIYIKKIGSKKTYCLSCPDNCWGFIEINNADSLWDKYKHILIELMSTKEPILTYDSNERLLAEMKGERVVFSEAIREGMLKTLLMYCCYRRGENRQQQVDSIVNEIIVRVKSPSDWEFMANYFVMLCEISPQTVLKRLLNEFKENTGLLQIFERKESDYLFGRNAYIKILWGLEDLLVQKDYARLALEVLIRINGKNYEYSANKPEDLIKKALCIWCNTTAIQTVEEKYEIAKFAIQNDDNAWEYIKEEISSLGGRSIVTTSNGPLYRASVDNKEVTLEEYYDLKDLYTELLLEKMCFRVDRWKELLKVSDNQNETGRAKIFSKLCDEIVQMDDDEIIQIKNCIRELIYRHRYFSSADWAMSEEVVAEYEKLLERLKVSTEELEYGYLFGNEFQFPLAHPVPYDKDDFLTGKDANKEAAEKLINEKIKEFKQKKLDVSKLVEMCAHGNTTLGKMLAKYWDDGVFNKEIYLILLDNDESGRIALDYCRFIKGYDEIFDAVLDITKEINNSVEIIVGLYKIQTEQSKLKPRIFKASKRIKKAYWKEEWIPINSNYIRESIWECKKYGSPASFIKTLYICCEHIGKNTIEVQDIYEFMLGFEKMEKQNEGHVDAFMYRDILETLQKEYIDDEEKCRQIALWELNHFYQLDLPDMKCLKRQLVLSPSLFMDMVSLIFKHDHDEQSEKLLTEQEKNRNSNLFSLYYKAEFCPGEINGSVDKQILTNWLNEFNRLLEINNQKSLKMILLGRLFAYSPLGSDGHYPSEPIREAIELLGEEPDIHKLQREYVITIENQRGVYSPTGGEAERRIAEDYKREADYHRIKYPIVAEMYDVLYDHYIAQADYEREAEENGWS